MADFYFWWVPVMAQAVGGDTVSLGALGAFIALVLGAVAAFIAKKKGKQEGVREEANRRVSIEGQPVGVKLEEELVTRMELQTHIQRIEGDIGEIKEALDGERGIARTANSNIHRRIDAMGERLGERLAKLEGSTEKIAETTDKLLDLALSEKAKPRGGAR